MFNYIIEISLDWLYLSSSYYKLLIIIFSIRIIALIRSLTCTKATAVQVLRLTRRPNRDLPFTIQYGTPILRQRAGKNKTTCNKRQWMNKRE